MSLSRKNKIKRIKDNVKGIPKKYKIHQQCENLEYLTEKELSKLLEKLRLKKYKLSNKGIKSEHKYQKSQKGRKSYEKRLSKWKNSKKGKLYKATRKRDHNKRWREENKDKIRIWINENKNYWKKWRNKNRLNINKKRRERWKNDKNYKIKSILRHRLYSLLRNNKKEGALDLLGCSLKFFIKYIENKFTEEMTWEKVMNGEIHIDHIKPCHQFNMENKKEREECFNYLNLRPLWSTTRTINGVEYIGNLNRKYKERYE